MKKLFFLLSCLLVLSSTPVLAVDPPFIIVRVYESGSLIRLVIERGTEKAEEIEFEGGYSHKEQLTAAKGYFTALAKFYQQGYVIQQVVPGASSGGGSGTSTLIFVKALKP